MKKIAIISAILVGGFLSSCKKHTACAAYTKAKVVELEKAG